MMDNRIVIFVGCYGSGKTEWSINYAFEHLNKGEKVRLFDLDIVNPYFSVREYKDSIEGYGIDVVSLSNNMKYADMPIFNSDTLNLVRDDRYIRVLDIGGEAKGARVLSQIKDSIYPYTYSMFMVVNIKRPFTEDVGSIIRFYRDIERVSKMKITGFINNTNLMDLTDLEVIEEGNKVLKKVSKMTGVPLRYIGVVSGSIRDSLAKRYPKDKVWFLRQFVKRYWKGGV